MRDNESKSLKLKWLTPALAKQIPEGSTVLIRTNYYNPSGRPMNGRRGYYVEGRFRHTHIENSGGYGVTTPNKANGRAVSYMWIASKN